MYTFFLIAQNFFLFFNRHITPTHPQPSALQTVRTLEGLFFWLVLVVEKEAV